VALGYSVRIRCGVASYSEGYGKFYVSTAADTEIDRNKSVTYYGPYSGTTADVRNLTFTYNNLTGGEHYIDLEYYQLYWYSSTGDFNYGYLDSIEVRYAGQDEWKTLTMQQEERTVEVDVINDQVYYLANNDYGVYNTMVVKDVFLNVPPLEYLEGTARLETVYGDVYVQFTAGEPPVSGSDPNPLISADDPRLSLVNQ
jgi:hypothetical protein